MKSCFPGVLGNKKTRERIGSAILAGTLPHALLVIGPDGSGKSTLAREIAAALNCERRESDGIPLPCGECNCCKRIYGLNFPDVKTLSKPKDRATIGVEAIKDFREDMLLSSTESEYKIYVIDDAECMTTEAQNALLKVLEEPPSRVIIIMLSREGDKILTTIKSRAQQIFTERFPKAELKEYLMKLSSDARLLSVTDPKRLDDIIMSADGRLGTAIMLTDSRLADENEAQRKDVCEIIRCITDKHSFAEIQASLSRLSTKRAELMEELEMLIGALRDIIAAKSCESCATVFYASAAEARAVCPTASVKRLITVYDELMAAHDRISKNAGITNIITTLAARLKFI